MKPGDRYNKLTAIKPIARNRRQTVHWEFHCDCGNTKIIEKYPVKNGRVKSCGCVHKIFKIGVPPPNKTHGMNGTRFHHIFYHILYRCNNKNCGKYPRYGGRGIKCLWSSFDEFKHDMLSSYEEHVKIHGIKETTIDRIDNDGNYCKDNCRWATYKIQARSTTSTQFKKKSIHN